MLNSTQSKIRWLMIAFSLITLAPASFAQVTRNARPDPVVIEVHGQVRYANTGVLAERVLVRVEGFGSGLNGQTLTDSSGKFRFQDWGGRNTSSPCARQDMSNPSSRLICRLCQPHT